MVSPANNPTLVSIEDSIAQIRRSLTFKRQLLMDGGVAEIDLTRPMLDAIGLFDALYISYAVIGGIASMVYGTARHTLDVGFVAASGHEQTLAANPDMMRRHQFDPGCTWKLYHGSGVDIDIWKDEHADGIIGRAVTQTFRGHRVRVADPHDLIAMKLRADRGQDVYDISELIKHVKIDRNLIRQRVTPDQFDWFVEICRRFGPRDR